MSENQIIHGNGSSQMENNVDKVENLVVEPKNFNNYHNSVVVNVTINVLGDMSIADLPKINQKTDLEQKSSCVFISHSHHFRRDDLTLSQVISLCSQISKK